jgi:hypothetical protein
MVFAGRLYVLLSSFIAYSTRRWTGFNPSRTSGNARPTMTLIAYSRYDFFSSSSIATGSISFPNSAMD